MRCCFNVCSKADMSRLNLPHGTIYNTSWQLRNIKKCYKFLILGAWSWHKMGKCQKYGQWNNGAQKWHSKPEISKCRKQMCTVLHSERGQERWLCSTNVHLQCTVMVCTWDLLDDWGLLHHTVHWRATQEQCADTHFRGKYYENWSEIGQQTANSLSSSCNYC